MGSEIFEEHRTHAIMFVFFFRYTVHERGFIFQLYLFFKAY